MAYYPSNPDDGFKRGGGMPVSESGRPANRHHRSTILPLAILGLGPILGTLNSDESEQSAGLRFSSWRVWGATGIKWVKKNDVQVQRISS